MKKVKNILRNEKGLTLIELLAVVVILGIIAAIAIPAIGGIIENSKKDAYISSAEQVLNSARLAISTDAPELTDLDADGTGTITTDQLIAGGLIEELKDPSDKTVDLEGTVTVDEGIITGITLGDDTTKYVLTAEEDELKNITRTLVE